MSHDIRVRAHTIQLEQEPDNRARSNNAQKCPDHALVFDCESRITADQMLTFGFWRFCERRNDRYVPVEEGIFHDDGLRGNEIAVLRDFAKAYKAEVDNDGCSRIRVYSRSKFVAEVLGLAIQAKAFIVCFNSGFDLSRIAVDWETAKNGGWSLILSKWRNPRTRELKPNKFFPRIVVKALNSKTSIIHSTRAPMSERGRKTKK